MSNWVKTKVCKGYFTASNGKRLCTGYKTGYVLKKQQKKRTTTQKRYVKSGNWFANMIQNIRKSI